VIPRVNCTVLRVKEDWKHSPDACALSCQHCAVYSVYPSGMTSHSIIAHFDCKCMDPYRENIFANQKQNGVLPLSFCALC
jgi:hypothetical protein